MATFAEVGSKLAAVERGLTDPRVIRAAGMAAKRAALDVANDVTGGDGRLSGWGKRGVKLGVGFDQTGATEVTINLRPGGPWKVMEQGRNGGKLIKPKKRSGAKALATPFGPRRSVVQGAMAGKGAVSKSHEQGARDAVRAAEREVAQILREVF